MCFFAGTAVGALGAQSIGEPGLRQTLVLGISINEFAF